MNTEKEYITKDKQKALIEELEQLQSVKRREIIESLEYAKSLGDLSENAEYHQAREAQAKLEERIQEIQRILKDAEVVSKEKGDTIGIGAEVEVKKKGEKSSKVFFIVGEGEADTSVSKISYQSPLGSALFGKKKGEVATFNSPSGPIEYKIISIK